MQCALDEKVLFSEKFMMMFEIRKEEMMRNGMVGGEMVGERLDGGELDNELVGDKEDGERIEEGAGYQQEDPAYTADHDELSCRDFIENKVIKYVSKLQDQNIEQLERIKKSDQSLRDLECSCSKLSTEKHEISNQKSQLENKYKRVSDEKSSLGLQVIELNKSEEMMGKEVKRLKGMVREVEERIVLVEVERDLVEGDVGRLRALVKERNARLEEMTINVTDLKNDLESEFYIVFVVVFQSGLHTSGLSLTPTHLYPLVVLIL